MKSITSAAIHVSACLVSVLAFSTPADASLILVYREIETVTASVSVTGAAGDTYSNVQQVSGSILSDPDVSAIVADAHLNAYNIPDGYLSPLGFGSGAGIQQQGAGLGFMISTGYGECNPLACSVGMARGDVDMTFRAEQNAGLEISYYPTGGSIDALLVDLTTHTIVYQDHVTAPSSWSVRPTFEFENNHLYRWVASGLALSPPAGDPYGDFAFRFFDRATLEDADIAPVPEPLSIILLGTGVAGMLVRRRARGTP